MGTPNDDAKVIIDDITGKTQLTDNDAITIINRFISIVDKHYVNSNIVESLKKLTDEEKLEIAVENMLNDALECPAIAGELAVSTLLSALLMEACKRNFSAMDNQSTVDLTLLLTNMITSNIPDVTDRIESVAKLTGGITVADDVSLHLNYLITGPQLVRECAGVLRKLAIVKNSVPLIIHANYGTNGITYTVTRVSETERFKSNRYVFRLGDDKVFNLTNAEINEVFDKAEIDVIKEKINENMKMLNLKCSFTMRSGGVDNWDGFSVF